MSARQGARTAGFYTMKSRARLTTAMRPPGLGLALFLGAACLGSDEAPVTVELVVPPAVTHVIGDHTPLIWRFRNSGTEPLAFMWEGCCRLNGRLTVSAVNLPIDPVPPGQALAHMFAKAERLEPGRPADFATRLSDWVHLRESGEYQLEGRYTGVLPEQTPQVPRGLKLWRDMAVTGPIRVRLVSVADYLAERRTRSDTRGLRLELSGPTRLPALAPNPLALEIHNTSGREQRLHWPKDFQLWIVDGTGRRLGNVPTSVEGAYRELALAPGASERLSVPFGSGLLEGERFGEYQVFVDLRAGDEGEPRTPTNPIMVEWRLGRAEVGQLLRQAAEGSKVGMRNAPLKLLRVYVGELGEVLDMTELSGASPSVRVLRDQLRLASCLKVFGPMPGRVEVPLQITTDGRATLTGPAVTHCLGEPGQPAAANDLERLQKLLSVRRHLGWEVGLEVRPDPDVAYAALRGALQPYFKPELELAGPPRALCPDGTTNAPVALGFRAAALPAELLIRVRKSEGTLTVEAARKRVTVSPAAQPVRFRPEEVHGAAFVAMDNPSALAELAEPQDQALVLVEGQVQWGELLKALQPLIARRIALDLL